MKRVDFVKNFSTEYSWLLRNDPKLLTKIMPLEKVVVSFKECYESALSYNSKKEWQIGCRRCYRKALKMGWLYKCCKHMKIRRGASTTLRECIESARKFSSKVEWKGAEGFFYRRALKNKWIAKCCGHMVSQKGKHSKKLVINLDTRVIFKTSTSNIRKVCSKRGKTAGGYRWAYCDKDGSVLK